MQALLRRHRLLQHVQAYWTHELAVQAPRTDRDLRVIGDGLLGRAMELVKRQLPGLVQPDLLRRRHVCVRVLYTPHYVYILMLTYTYTLLAATRVGRDSRLARGRRLTSNDDCACASR